MNPIDTDIVIIGCGPVGGSLAAMLGQAGVRVTVLEREQSYYHLPRAVHMDSETMRTLDAIDCAEPLMPLLYAPTQCRFMNAEGKTLMLLDQDIDTDQGWRSDYQMHQPDLESVLRARLATLSSVELLTQRDAFAVTDHGNRATVRFEDSRNGTTHQIACSYVVGCDGARSLVRRMISERFDDLGLHQPWLVIDLIPKDGVDFGPEVMQFCDPARPATYVPAGPRRGRWEIMAMPGDDLAELTQPEAVWRLLSDWVTPDQADLERAVVYTFHSLVAQTWREGRLMVAGDAAHQMPPFLGQGMCAGIRDAFNLSWKLARVILHDAPIELLDTYEPERRAHVAEVTRVAVEIGSVIQATGVDAERRDAEMLAGGVPRELRQPVPALGPGLHGAAPPPAGCLAPHWNFDGRRGDDVTGPGFAVVAEPTLLGGASEITRRRWEANEVSVHEAGADALAWLREHGARGVVIRPDRYVLGVATDAEGLDRISGLLPSPPPSRSMNVPSDIAE